AACPAASRTVLPMLPEIAKTVSHLAPHMPLLRHRVFARNPNSISLSISIVQLRPHVDTGNRPESGRVFFPITSQSQVLGRAYVPGLVTTRRPSSARTNSPVIRLALYIHSNTAAHGAWCHLLTPRKGATTIRTPVPMPAMVLQWASGLAEHSRCDKRGRHE